MLDVFLPVEEEAKVRQQARGVILLRISLLKRGEARASDDRS